MPPMRDKGIPLSFVTLPDSVTRAAISGYTDELAGESRKAEAVYRQHVDCPRGCGATMVRTPKPANAVYSNEDWCIPTDLVKCTTCGYCKDPFTGLTVEVGDKDKTYGVPLINPMNG